MKKYFPGNLLILFVLLSVSACTQPQTEYTFVAYNIENLFDADGVAIYDDYKPADKAGNPQYTPVHVLNKIKNAVRVLQQYNDGKGPDVLAVIELESDYTPVKAGDNIWDDETDFLSFYAHTTLEKMLGSDFDETIADLPSQLLLLKGMTDAGMWPYQVAVGSSLRDKNGLPTTVQKNAVYSRFPINREKTRAHPLQQARSILEAWLNIDGADLVVFANHWKSGAGSAEMEAIRLQNAEVLRSRLDEITAETPNTDFILAGDFNSDYNQKTRYNFPKTAINDVLKSTGDELSVAEGRTNAVYNLWYEYPIEQRGSDTYRGYWGTLMQIMVSTGMYDAAGISYVDNSFDVGDFGFNTYHTSGEPRRWDSAYDGTGYSDHLPVSMKFKVASGSNHPQNPSITDDADWSAIPVYYALPDTYFTATDFSGANPESNPEFYDRYFRLTATVAKDYKFVVDGKPYLVYTPSFRLNNVLGEIAGTERKIEFYGRFVLFRGEWEFIVESPEFITILE